LCSEKNAVTEVHFCLLPLLVFMVKAIIKCDLFQANLNHNA